MQSPGQEDAERRPGKRPAARGTAFYPRKRANTACQVCRARKTKCDNQKPACSYCVSVGAACIQSPVDLSAFDPASLKILERLDDLERLMKESRKDRTAEDASSVGFQASPLESSTEPAAKEVPLLVGASFKGDGEVEDLSLRSILPEKLESLLQWSVFPGQPDQQLSPSGPVNTSSPKSSILGGLLDIKPHGINTLLDNFFIHVHCKNPIFEETSTRRLVTTTMLEGIDWSPNSCLSLLVCALGTIATPLGPSLDTKPDSVAYMESQSYFEAAQRRIGSLLCQSDIVGAQCLFLSGVYMICIYQPVLAWRFFSQALAACQTLPFLRRARHVVASVPEHSAEFLTLRADETQQQAVYWSAWKSERELRQELVLPDFNMPHSTSVLYPPFFPTPPQPLESMKTPDSERQRASWLFYLAEISLRRLSSRVCNEILELHRNVGSNTLFLDRLALLLPEYEAQARQWSDNLPPELSLRTPPEKDNICVYVLRGHFINFFETIYWPFLMAHLEGLESGSPIPSPGREIAQKGLHFHVRRVSVNEPGFLHRHHGTWGMIRGCIRSAVVLLGAGLLGCEMPPGWQEATFQVVQLTSLWEDEIPELSQKKEFLQQALMSLED
ncbi:Zcf27p [Neonectria punicea]|uniref:Zcf27p n=1 Tax=Neonectria punicea TaxID=979145 RepID=A0ABR1HSH7_9HYPO